MPPGGIFRSNQTVVGQPDERARGVEHLGAHEAVLAGVDPLGHRPAGPLGRRVGADHLGVRRQALGARIVDRALADRALAYPQVPCAGIAAAPATSYYSGKLPGQSPFKATDRIDAARTDNAKMD